MKRLMTISDGYVSDSKHFNFKNRPTIPNQLFKNYKSNIINHMEWRKEAGGLNILILNFVTSYR
jgi:hypothetical protein